MRRIKVNGLKHAVKEGDKVVMLINNEKIVIHHCHNDEFVQICMYVPKEDIEDTDLPF